MQGNVKCPACATEVEPDSVFCRRCGHRLEAATPASEEAELLARSANFVKDANDALAACFDYYERYPEGPATHDMKVTGAFILAYASYGGLARALESRNHSEVWDYTNYDANLNVARLFAAGVPPVLKNGLVTQARISGWEKMAAAGKFVGSARESESKLLLPLFEEARLEADALLVDGKTRALVEEKTKEQVYEDAEVYYRAYEEGDLEGAARGFLYLKQLNPLETYFRNVLGIIYSKQGKRREATREFLYGLHLTPSHSPLTSNLLYELTTVKLYASAVEVAAHYRRHGDRGRVPESDSSIGMLGDYATTILAALACAAAGVDARDYAPDADDFLVKLPLPDHPWLRAPAEPTTVEPGPLGGKRLFISYRRADGAEMAQRIQSRLKINEPSAVVFLDEAVMTGGEDFTEQIREAIEQADLFLLLIGPYLHSPEGRRRLKNTSDVLRREVAWAMRKYVPIIPVLLDDADMPSTRALPEELRAVAQLHAERLRADHFGSDWGQLLASMVELLQKRAARDRAVEQELDELEELMKKDPEAGKRRIEKVLGPDVNEEFLEYLPAKSEQGEGISGPINWFGVWECTARRPGAHLSLRLVIEDRGGGPLTGEYRIHDARGRITRTNKLRGEWARVIDFDAELTLGLYLNAVLDNGERARFTIPFHEKVGDTLVGTDRNGLQFTSRNVEPRAGGF